MCVKLEHMQIRGGLPEHPVPDRVRQTALGSIRIHGLVERELTVDAGELAVAEHVTLEEPFTCEEGWTVPGLRWTGISLADVLARARPLATARFVHVWSGSYSISLPLAQAERVLLCDMLDGVPLPIQHGGPWRLVIPGGQCFSSVKWVDRLELTLEEGQSTGELIARQRLAPSADFST